MACTRHGAPWPEGEASLARELGKLHGFRRWCEALRVELRPTQPLPEGGHLIPPAQLPGGGGLPMDLGGLLRPARIHLACRLGRRWMCLNCFHLESGGVEAFRRARCGGAAPIPDVPDAVLKAVVRYGAGAGLAGPLQARAAALWANSGVPAAVLLCAVQPATPVLMRETAIGQALARGHRQGGDPVLEGPEGRPLRHDSPGPLAAAAGAAGRCALKRRRTGPVLGDAHASGS